MTNTARVDLSENAVYIIQNGKVITLTSKKHGEDRIIWKNGKVLDVDRSERVRIEEQEVI